MTHFRDNRDGKRFEQGFTTPEGETGVVFADYIRDGDTVLLRHVEADPALRGSGAAGRFMEALAEHARQESLTVKPLCSYAVAWFRRNKAAQDLLA